MTGRGWGKALALDTPILTSLGFKSMGDIAVGDTVFDDDGCPATVTLVTPTMFNRNCYEVIFSDGSVLVADQEHLWQTHTHRSRKAQGRAEHPRALADVRTTQEIKDTLTYCDRGDVNHSIECTKPLRLPRRKLAVNPYTLGAWLGDGSSASAEITGVDEEVFNWIQADG